MLLKFLALLCGSILAAGAGGMFPVVYLRNGRRWPVVSIMTGLVLIGLAGVIWGLEG